MATRRELQKRVEQELDRLEGTRYAGDNHSRARTAVSVFEDYIKERGGEILFEQIYEPEPTYDDD